MKLKVLLKSRSTYRLGQFSRHCRKIKNRKTSCVFRSKNLNKAIKRENFQLPTIKIASRLPLNKASQLLTTFHSQFGRYCFSSMPFGIKSAQEIFQKRSAQHFDNIDGGEVKIDDILIWVRNEEEHNRRLRTI